MLLFDGALGVIAIGVWIFCIIDVITTPEKQVRNLPKLFWLLIVILLVDIGSIAWLFAGRPWSEKARARNVGGTGDRGWGPAARSPIRPSNPDDDEDFLAGLRARAEEQRRRARDTKQGEEPQGGAGPTA